MHTYPSIPKIIQDIDIYAFDKLDGSNIRVEWTRKGGFVKFGTRTRLLDPNEKPLGEAATLIEENFTDALSRIFVKARYQKATAFFEFYGDHSFAGLHADEPHQVRLIDVHEYKQTIVLPAEFVRTYADRVPTAELLYRGKPNSMFVESVRNGTLPGMTFEGVVCKGGLNKLREVTMFKIKNQAWLDALKHKCGDDISAFNRLA